MLHKRTFGHTRSCEVAKKTKRFLTIADLLFQSVVILSNLPYSSIAQSTELLAGGANHAAFVMIA
jgi:hypothetical protein